MLTSDTRTEAHTKRRRRRMRRRRRRKEVRVEDEWFGSFIVWLFDCWVVWLLGLWSLPVVFGLAAEGQKPAAGPRRAQYGHGMYIF